MKTNEVFEFLLDCCPVKPNLGMKNYAEEIEQGITTLSYNSWAFKVAYVASFCMEDCSGMNSTTVSNISMRCLTCFSGQVALVEKSNCCFNSCVLICECKRVVILSLTYKALFFHITNVLLFVFWSIN